MIINQKGIKCSIYLMLYIGYSIFSLVYPGTMLSKVFLLLFMLFSGYYMLKSFGLAMGNSSNYIKSLLGLIVLFTIYGLVYYVSPYSYAITEGIMRNEVPKIEYLKNIYLSLLPIFSFYYFSSKGLISEAWIKKMSLILLALAIFMYTYSYEFFVVNDEYGRIEMTNNYGYSFVALFPLICFWHKKPLVQLLYMTILLVYIVMSMKRGAILLGVICSLYVLITILRNTKKWARVGIVLGFGVLLYVGLPILSDFIVNSEHFQQRILQTMEGDSSNRNMLYSTALHHIFNETTLFDFLFGTGADSSIGILTNYAHNDWLEIGINQGVIGVIFYMLYFISFYKLWHKKKNTIGYLNSVIGLCFIICFIKTFFSMSYNNMDISISLSIGFILSVIRNHTIYNNRSRLLK